MIENRKFQAFQPDMNHELELDAFQPDMNHELELDAIVLEAKKRN